MAGFVAVHTGAGNCVDETKYQRVIREACIRASALLKHGGSAMDACEMAIIVLENCGNTNAGYGSNLCLDGRVQCDASIMDGSNLRFGACTNVSTLKNPIQLARKICDGQSRMLALDRIPPMVMAGVSAEQYAEKIGCTMVEANSLISSKAKFSHDHYKSKALNVLQHSTDFSEVCLSEPTALDTVGAVCVDDQGNAAAGCSSGGLLLKLPGRVGQAATYGAGCWARTYNDMALATCTTGNGEYLMKTMLAREICDDLSKADCAATSLHKTFKCKFLESPFLEQDQELYGGALALLYYPKSHSGEVLWSQTTKSFCLGYMSSQQKTPKFVFSALPTYSVPGRSSVVNGQSFNLRL